MQRRSKAPCRATEAVSHSLWYCDAHDEGQFGWYEVAFIADLRARAERRVEGGCSHFAKGCDTLVTSGNLSNKLAPRNQERLSSSRQVLGGAPCQD